MNFSDDSDREGILSRDGKKREGKKMVISVHHGTEELKERYRDGENAPKKVIFLDIDGVLNRDDGGVKIEEEFVKRLAHIVEETEAEIILSSSWRGMYERHVDSDSNYKNENVGLLLDMLERYSLVISGTTPDLSSGPYARPMEIRVWLEAQKELERFVILDDETFWQWNWLGDYFVCTTHRNENGRYVCGMTDEDAEKAIEILNRPLVKLNGSGENLMRL